MCDLPHVAGAGCIKCTGVVSSILRGEAVQPTHTDLTDLQVTKCQRCQRAIASTAVPDDKSDAQHDCACRDGDRRDDKKEDGEEYGTEPAGRVPELAVCEGPLGHPLPMAHPDPIPE